MTTKHSPFESVYGVKPLMPISLIDLPSNCRYHQHAEQQAQRMLNLHEQIKANIIKANDTYTRRANKKIKPKNLQEGDLVWIHLRKERFPKYRQNKLLPRADGPFKILKKIGDNAYKIDLPKSYAISNTFNVGDLTKYEGDNELGTILLEEGGDDPSMDHVENTRVKTSQDTKANQEETNKEECITNPLPTNLGAAHLDLALRIIDNQLQSRTNMNLKEDQGQEESRRNLIAAFKQDRTPHSDQQPTERQTSEQPTLHSLENSACCTNECGNWENGIFIHGPRSQGPRTLLVVTT